MGIPKFFGAWFRHLNGVFVNNPQEGQVEGVLVDMNDLLHKTAEIIYAYGETATPAAKERASRSSEDQLAILYDTQLTAHLDWLLKQCRPRQYLILCVDGVAPVAKLNQQRARRYKGRGMEGPFDPVMLTPGTQYMARIDLAIRTWIEGHQRLPPVVIYSSFRLPGEGEHKMFRILETEMKEGRIDEGRGYHLVTGMDSDLVMLTTVSPVRSIVLMRENKSARRYDYISISSFRRVLLEKMSPRGVDRIPEMVYRDFVLILFLIGNDFLPHLSAFHDISLSIEILLCAYVKAGQYLTNDNGIIWENVKGFLAHIITAEQNLLKEQGSIEYTTDYSILLNHVQRHKLQATAERYEVTAFDFSGYREAWYRRSFPYSTDLTADVNNMCSTFMVQMEWVLAYYLRKDISYLRAYPFPFAPLIYDLHRVVDAFAPYGYIGFKDVLRTPQDPQPEIINQLLSVIPPRMSGLLPSPFNRFIDFGGYLFDLCPSQPIIIADGKTEEWRHTVIMPLADYARVSLMSSTVNPQTLPERVRPGNLYLRTRPRLQRTGLAPAFRRPEDSRVVTRDVTQTVSRSPREKKTTYRDPARRRTPHAEVVWTDRNLL